LSGLSSLQGNSFCCYIRCYRQQRYLPVALSDEFGMFLMAKGAIYRDISDGVQDMSLGNVMEFFKLGNAIGIMIFYGSFLEYGQANILVSIGSQRKSV
jgi:hypothetical protein